MSTAADYWLGRAEANMDLVQAQADRRLQVIAKAMQQAQEMLTEDAQRIFRRFAGKFNLTDAEAQTALAEPLGRAEYNKLLEKIATLPAGTERTALEIRVNSGAYAYRISRAEALRENIAIETARISQVVEDELTGQLRFTAVESYNRNTFDLQCQTGRAFAVPDINGTKVAIDAPWAGGNYSSRIWGNRDKLATALQQEITAGYMSGESYTSVARRIQEQFGVSFRNAERLVRTETSYIANQAQLQAYLDADIEQYRYITALDSRTCKVCAPLDRQVFNVSDAVVGRNYPPIHPNCRCTTGMAIELTPDSQRRGRDGNGKSVLLPADMTYDEWREWQLSGAPDDVKLWRRSKLEKYSGVRYNKSGTVVVTDDWTGRRKSIPRKYIANAVVDSGGEYNGRVHQIDRSFYDSDGYLYKQVHSSYHGNRAKHPFGINGEHVHDYLLESQTGKLEKYVRELTDVERKENSDIL